MSLLVRDRPAPSTRNAFAPNTIPGPSEASGGLAYSYRTNDAFKIAAVQACIGLRAGAFAQLPLKAYEDRDGSPMLVDQQPELLLAPSSQRVVVPSVWKTQMSISRDVWGYAAGRIKAVDAAGKPAKVDWVCPSDIRVDDTGGVLQWWFAGQPVDSSLVFHIPSRWVMPGSPLGMSPLEKTGLVELARQAQDFGRDWFRNGAVPSAILFSDEKLTSEQADTLLNRLVSRWRRRQPGVLGSGLRYEQVSVNANESQFLETMQRAAADIAISFNLPPEMIAAAVSTGSTVTYANREQNVQQYLMQSINPDLVVIQEVLGLHMRSGTYPRWSTAAFLRADLKTRYEAYKTGLESEFLTVDEVRAWEELPPLRFEDGPDDDPAD